MNRSLFGALDAPGGADRQRGASTVVHVFKLIWPEACIDCRAGEDCYLVGVCAGEMRHVVRVPCALVQFDLGLTLVRAVYKSGIPANLQSAESALSVSL